MTTLPHSKLAFLISSRLSLAGFPDDPRRTIEPDVPVPYTYRDYSEGNDPVLEAALAYNVQSCEPFELEEAALTRYEGRYLFSPSQILTVRRFGNELRCSITDFIETSYLQFQSDLFPVSESELVSRDKSVRLRFTLDENEDVETVAVNWRGTEKTLERAPEDLELPFEMVRNGRIDEGLRAFLDNKEENLRRYLPMETNLNLWGYELLQNEQYGAAIKMLVFTTRLYPQSSNAFDSLGEAYMSNGDIEPAIRSYRRSLELNPDNANAVKMLKKLGVRDI
jgi:tetratricopeptide (TPR) repeat protein